MVVVGLTGGIGSGKSTVAAMLAERGAAVVDADAIARRVVEPTGQAYQPVVDRFGPRIVASDGTVDRSRLAALVFSDPAARADLEAIVHPAVRAGVAERLAAEAAAATDVVVVEIPLLVESPASRAGLAAVVAVDCPEDVAVARLVEQRGMAEADVRARVAAQATRAERLAAADFVVDNSGTRQELVREVQRCWEWLEGLEGGDSAT